MKNNESTRKSRLQSLSEIATDETESHVLRLAALLEVVGHRPKLPRHFCEAAV